MGKTQERKNIYFVAQDKSKEIHPLVPLKPSPFWKGKDHLNNECVHISHLKWSVCWEKSSDEHFGWVYLTCGLGFAWVPCQHNRQVLGWKLLEVWQKIYVWFPVFIVNNVVGALKLPIEEEPSDVMFDDHELFCELAGDKVVEITDAMHISQLTIQHVVLMRFAL